jgi:shikimate dehydrogenase
MAARPVKPAGVPGYHGGLFDRPLRMDRYVVIGNPIAHSLSPAIHTLFARQTGEALEYTRLLIERGHFSQSVGAFFEAGGRGASVTLPFKSDALEFATEQSARARRAGAANFLMKRKAGIFADNTDGAGLVADLTRNLGFHLRDTRILLLGAGGAARGVLGPLLAERPRRIVVANRTVDRARALEDEFGDLGEVAACALDVIEPMPFDLVLNATSTSTLGLSLPLPDAVFATGTLAYDLAYGASARAFTSRALAAGARVTDGLGMLVEQAAEAFEMWRGKRPSTAPVLAELRASRG